VTLRSRTAFRFGTDWLRLSPSDPYDRYLVVNPDGSEMSFCPAGGDPLRRVVPTGAIVLTEYRADEQVYVAHVPRLDPHAELADREWFLPGK